jgi:hypothetical protein
MRPVAGQVDGRRPASASDDARMASHMTSVRDDEHAVPAVFASDDDGPRRVWLRVEVKDGEIVCSCRTRHGAFEEEHTFSFYRTERRGFLLNLIAWRDVTFSRPRRLPLSPACIQTRIGTRRPRVSLTPPRPLDFTLHMYDSPQLPLCAILTALRVPHQDNPLIRSERRTPNQAGT